MFTKGKIIGAIGILATIIGYAATALQDWVTEKKVEEMVEEKVHEMLTEKREEEEEEP